MSIELPDELVVQILSQTSLWMHDEQFETQNGHPVNSGAGYLAVCKSWFRVGIPFLYHTIVLRSPKQAAALALIFRGDRTRGRLVQRLRIEAGIGGIMYSIVKATPWVKTLCLTLFVSNKDNVSGLCRALPLLDPTRVVLYDRYRENSLVNPGTWKLREVLEACLSGKWTKMKQLHFPYPLGTHSIFFETLSEAIKNAPSLRQLEMPFVPHHPDLLLVMAQNPELQTILVDRTPNGRTYNFMNFAFDLTVEGDKRLKELVVFRRGPTSVLRA